MCRIPPDSFCSFRFTYLCRVPLMPLRSRGHPSLLEPMSQTKGSNRPAYINGPAARTECALPLTLLATRFIIPSLTVKSSVIKELHADLLPPVPAEIFAGAASSGLCSSFPTPLAEDYGQRSAPFRSMRSGLMHHVVPCPQGNVLL